MQLEVGSIVDGKVTGITKFGAFVELPTGKVGLVHISEVSTDFVKEIKDHLTEGQSVKVKILNISEDGKVGLSIKQAVSTTENNPTDRPFSRAQGLKNVSGGTFVQKERSRSVSSFEDMMAHYKKVSDEKMRDLSRATDVRRGSSSRHGNQAR